MSISNNYRDLTEVPCCPVCENKERIIVYSCPRYNDKQNKYIVSCTNCHMHYVSPLILQRYEEIPLKDFNFGTINFLGFIHLAQVFEIYLHSYGLIKPPSQRNLMEIGCGTGHLMDIFRSREWNVTGIEIWKSLADWGIKHFHLDIKKNFEDIFILPDNFYDAIVMTEVLEHLVDPCGVLKICYAKLKNYGSIFITCPNFASKARDKLGWEWAPIDPYGHIQYFTANTLTLAMTKVGFTLIEINVAGGEAGDEQLIMCATKK